MKIKTMSCLVCVLFQNKVVCKDDVLLAFKATNYESELKLLYHDVQDSNAKWD